MLNDNVFNIFYLGPSKNVNVFSSLTCGIGVPSYSSEVYILRFSRFCWTRDNMNGKAEWQARGPWEITRDTDTDSLLEKHILNVLFFILIVHINSV